MTVDVTVGQVRFTRGEFFPNPRAPWETFSPGIDVGPLDALEELALVHGRLRTVFGPPDAEHEFFDLELLARLDETCVAFSISDQAGRLSCAHSAVDGPARTQLRAAFTRLLNQTSATDFVGAPGKYSYTRYGCARGAPYHWGGPTHPDWATPHLDPHSRLPRQTGAVRLVAEPSATAETPSENALREFYAAHLPPGAPPFEQLREHLAHAWAAARRPVDESAAEPFEGVLLKAMGPAVDALCRDAGAQPLSAALRFHPHAWVDSAEVARSLGRLLVRLDHLLESGATFEHARFPLSRRKDAWVAVAPELRELQRRTSQLAAQSRRLRLELEHLD